jgi:hypothetical protein
MDKMEYLLLVVAPDALQTTGGHRRETHPA